MFFARKNSYILLTKYKHNISQIIHMTDYSYFITSFLLFIQLFIHFEQLFHKFGSYFFFQIPLLTYTAPAYKTKHRGS